MKKAQIDTSRYATRLPAEFRLVHFKLLLLFKPRRITKTKVTFIEMIFWLSDEMKFIS